MHWIILILAGLMEVGFTFCLGKTKTATGQEQIWWWGGIGAVGDVYQYDSASLGKSPFFTSLI